MSVVSGVENTIFMTQFAGKMETAGSVSKGCFAFKGKKKKAKIDDYLPADKARRSRLCHATFVQMWEEIDTQIQILQSDFNCNIFEDLLNFTQTCHQGFSLEDTSRQNAIREIPAAALVTGVNTPDHSTMFSNLVVMLRDRVTPQVAILKSKDCQNVKSILSRTLSQLLDKHCLADEGDDEDDAELNMKSLPLTLSTLSKWYRNKVLSTKGGSSPKKRKSADGKSVAMATYPPVVIVMEDFENFIPRVVQDFIAIASNYISELPVVFVFGIATSVSAIHRLLPNEVSSLLCMEKFQAPPSTEYLTLVINQILMTANYPFKLGQGVFQLMLDIFLYHDFSVLNFIQALMFAMLDHYSTQSLSFLCCPLDKVESVVKTMDSSDVEQLRHLKSFMRYVEKCSVKEQPDLLLKDTFTKERIIHLIQGIHEYHTDFFPMLKCLHALVGKLPGYPLGKQVREVYSMTLQSDVFDSEDYKQAKDLLKMLSKDELRSLLQQCCSILTTETRLTSVMKEIEEYLNKIDHIDDVIDEEEEENTADTSLPSRTSLHQLRQRLQDISKQQKKLSPYEKLREEIVEYFDSLFRQYLMCPMNLPLHEIFYYNSSRTIKQRLNAAPRSALQMALSNPHYYLQCECCSTDSGQIKCTMPDTCIIYKLHLECGQLINLYDWMQAYLTVVQPEDEDIDSNEQSQQLQARFIQAVSQLQFLGFVKPTKRKTDHVARLTWGGC
ncbi:origin recognition complex subunit 3-like [Mercenaria mercenaria]|uniref:origin recognition complex subunit 3-like n=1 Tax=Mercenaria mercenaria TaxID=6596 RepID=UPI00234F84F4|nr:origin recognition complex subunit 3-like [Mercenaria mercenaria]